MPIYEYRCDSCSYQFEVKQSIKDAPLSTCERCGQSLRRLISSSGIMFKGSGWYVTDYSSKMKPPSEGEKPTTAGDKKETPAGSPSPASTTAAPGGTTPTPASNSTTSSPAPTPPTTNTPKS